MGIACNFLSSCWLALISYVVLGVYLNVISFSRILNHRSQTTERVHIWDLKKVLLRTLYISFKVEVLTHCFMDAL